MEIGFLEFPPGPLSVAISDDYIVGKGHMPAQASWGEVAMRGEAVCLGLYHPR